MPSIADIKLIIVGQVKCDAMRTWPLSGVTTWRCVAPDGTVIRIDSTGACTDHSYLIRDGGYPERYYRTMEDACIAAFGAWAA